MDGEKREKVINFLKERGWSEDRCVNTANFHYELMDASDNEFLGEKFRMFDSAKKFLSQFGALKLEWKHPKNDYNYKLIIDSRAAAVNPIYLKWYIAHFRCMLYPIGIYYALPGDLLIDEEGYFYFTCETFVRKFSNDFFELLYHIIFVNNHAIYKEIPYWEDAGYSDEFLEQWNYDFDELDRMKKE